MALREWSAGPASRPVREALERLVSTPGVDHVAVMPDVHLANDVCNGVVVLARDTVLPQAVGGDIGCGMAAIALHDSTDLLREERHAASILHACQTRIPVLKLHPGEADAGPEPPDASPLSEARLRKAMERDGRAQFGTLGRGNHFVELQADDQDRLWLMVHSGSRAMGQHITAHHLAHAEGEGSRLRWLDASGEAGQAYVHDAAWAVGYARGSRRRMIERLAAFFRERYGFDADETSYIDQPHNFVDLETHEGARYWVHRKGAMRVRLDELGVIPGSMGTVSHHIAGRGHEPAFLSCSHGAGRELSRTDARHAISRQAFRRQVGKLWYDQRIERALLEEAPGAYRDIRKVMRAQAELVRIVRTLHPLLVHKGA